MKKILFFLLTLSAGILIGYVGPHIYENHQTAELNREKLKMTPEDSLKYKAWRGDREAYSKLHGDYPPEGFLFWAMYMANKYDYAYAYEDVFITIEELYGDSAIYKMDDKTRAFALTYLKGAAQRGDSMAIDHLNEMRQQVPSEWLK
jgi:hypothetical protein